MRVHDTVVHAYVTMWNYNMGAWFRECPNCVTRNKFPASHVNMTPRTALASGFNMHERGICMVPKNGAK